MRKVAKPQADDILFEANNPIAKRVIEKLKRNFDD